MNCVELFLKSSFNHPSRMALATIDGQMVTFEQLRLLSASRQVQFKKSGLQSGDTVLLMGTLCVELYANIIACLANGSTCVLVEPWMSPDRIEAVIQDVKPKIFVTPWWGRIWGARVSAIRKIPKWMGLNIDSSMKSDLKLESVAPQTPGILTFTTGTTGAPKGVVRGQGYLVHQHQVLSKNLELEDFEEPDLCVFANFALANLASARGSVLVPKNWSDKNLRKTVELSQFYQTRTLTTGPAFLLKLMEYRLPSLKSIHVGGALTDCWIFEKGFQVFKDAHWSHIYGSSEAEPVAVCDAHKAVELSREKGYFQTLYVGHPVPEISAEITKDETWVTGVHVCPKYWGDSVENLKHKKQDSEGRIWHNMGDRIRTDSHGWWYSGRSGQDLELFEREQMLYSTIQSSKAFVEKEKNEYRYFIDSPEKYKQQLVNLGLNSVESIQIVRDVRHRARIDRSKSKKKRVTCQLG